MNKEWKICDVKITSRNWTRRLKSKAHLKNDPDRTIKPGKRVRVNGATRKVLLSQARKYCLKEFQNGTSNYCFKS